MRITKIKVSNFKSLVDFEIDLAKFNCIVGLNGSGKSTFLQFIDFIIHLMKGDVDDWFKRRDWKPEDLFNHFEKKKKNKEFSFSIKFGDGDKSCEWSATYRSKIGCRGEVVRANNHTFKMVINRETKKRSYVVFDSKDVALHKKVINFNYQGSIFAVLNDPDVNMKAFYHIRELILGMESFELLAPHFLRQRTRESGGSIGLEGKGLSSYLFELKKDACEKIVLQLKKVYNNLDSITPKIMQYGWKQLEVEERFKENLKTESRHINDGMLRLIAILAQLQSNRHVLVFDEIENGINQELVEFLINELVNAKQQIVVTTHSPLFLNYLDDDLARESVHYFYKTPEGLTRCRKFFSLPRISKKLEALGPGEAIADTDLYRLNEEIERLDRAHKEKED